MEAMATSAASSVVCVITGDRLFSRAHPNKIVEDGLAYRVRGDMASGLARLAHEQYSLPADADGWPLDTIDVVRWAGLRQVHLDRSGFIRRWQRYVTALERHILQRSQEEGGGADAADDFLLRSHTLAMKLMNSIDELDFLVGASEHDDGPLVVLQYLDDDPHTPHLLCLRAGCREASPAEQSTEPLSPPPRTPDQGNSGLGRFQPSVAQ